MSGRWLGSTETILFMSWALNEQEIAQLDYGTA
jgi:hypothetical protein